MSILIRYRPKPRRFSKGQTLAEYGMVLLTIAILVYAAYQLVGDGVGTLLNSTIAGF